MPIPEGTPNIKQSSLFSQFPSFARTIDEVDAFTAQITSLHKEIKDHKLHIGTVLAGMKEGLDLAHAVAVAWAAMKHSFPDPRMLIDFVVLQAQNAAAAQAQAAQQSQATAQAQLDQALAAGSGGNPNVPTAPAPPPFGAVTPTAPSTLPSGL